MPKIFISHAGEDNEVSRKIARSLTRDGANVWIYYAQIDIGNNLPESSKKAIEWCDIFVLIWSQFAARSFCVALECQNALHMNKNIIQCVVDNSKRSSKFQKFYYINFSKFEKGYSDLTHFLSINGSEAIMAEDNDDKTDNHDEMTSESIQLRGTPENLTEKQVEAMIKQYNFFDVKRNKSGLGNQKKFEIQELNSCQIIIDQSIGLMWQRGGSFETMWYDKTKNWIAELNQNKHAGYADWRLPTLEEAMTLMTPINENESYYIDPIFDKKQSSIWTADLTKNALRAWVVFYNYGSCYENCFDFNNYVRAVRTVNPR